MLAMFRFSRRIYADTAAATSIDHRVASVVAATSRHIYGNPSSINQEGVLADRVLSEARGAVANFLGTHADEIVFTGSGTESNSLAIIGTYLAYQKNFSSHGKRPRIIILSIEHSSVLEAARWCEARGAEVVLAPVDQEGVIQMAVLKELLTPETILISVSLVNNEIGVIQPIRELVSYVRQLRKKEGSDYPYFHTDACQASRFLPMVVDSLGVDLLTINSSKVYGPKGVGALYIRRGSKVLPLSVGGGQEFGMRSGTQNVPGIVGFAKALELAQRLRGQERERLATLRDDLQAMLTTITGATVYGLASTRAPHILNIGFEGISAEDLVLGLDALGIAVSTGSACSSKSRQESHVLTGLGADAGMTSIRISLGRETVKSDIKKIAAALLKVVARLRRGAELL